MTSKNNAANTPASQNIASGNKDAGTFSQLLLDHRTRRGSRPAIREKKRGIWHTTTWADLADEAAALAIVLAERGLQRGAHVALLGDNKPRLYAAMSAAHALGAIAVPLYQDATADELVSLIAVAGATHVFAENQEQVDKLLTALPRLPSVRLIIYDADRGMRHYREPHLASYAEIVTEGRDLLAKNPDFLTAQAGLGSGSDPAFVFFTAGTAGPAKSVVFTHAALIGRARAMSATEGFCDQDVTLAYLPPGWVAQNIFSYVLPMLVGSCVCCPESSETMVADMREIGPSVFLASPRVLDALLTQITTRIEDASPLGRGLYRHFMTLAERDVRRELSRTGKPASGRLRRLIGNPLIYAPIRDIFGLSRVRVAYTTGDAIDPDLIVFFRALGINLKQLYGSTEAAFLIALHRDGDVRLGTVGTAIEGVDVKLGDNREILVRSEGLFNGYHGGAEGLSDTRNDDGWLRTGDAGHVSDDGHIRIVDSLSNIGRLTSGALFAPRAIESKLKFFPYIKEVVAFGDGREAVCALVDIDAVAVSRWADKRSISYTGNADLASREEIYDLVAGCIEKLNQDLARDAEFAANQIVRFAVLPKELSPDDGLLTRTGKPRRAAIATKFKPIIEAMYAGKAEVAFDVDGPGPDKDVLRIRDAATSAPAKPRRAA